MHWREENDHFFCHWGVTTNRIKNRHAIRETLQVPGTAENAAKAVDGEAPEEEKPMPDVPPPDFINCCKAVLLNFGNLNIDEERGDLSAQIKLIASEAEVVATRIYGKGMSPREQQVSRHPKLLRLLTL